MIKQLRKVGNSQALILDKPILELLGLEEEGQVKLTIQNGSLIVTPARPGLIDPKSLGEGIEFVMKKRKDLLKRLAE